MVESDARFSTKGGGAAVSLDMSVGGEAADVKRDGGVERGIQTGSLVSGLDSASLGLTKSDDDP